MQGHGSTGSKPAQDDDSEHAPLTPRGMAAPPPPLPARRPDGDPGRPATIRIEANLRAPQPLRRDPDLERNGVRPPRAPAATSASGEWLRGLLLSQGLLLNAFVLLLVFGWTSPLPGRRYLLGAFAIGGIAVAVLIHFALRGARARAASDAPRQADAATVFSVWFSGLAVRALPAALVTGWVALGIYALALPPTANASEEPHANTHATRHP